MARLWDKGEATKEQVMEFTVGIDPILDLSLLPWDCVGSAAHARMLQKINLISATELNEALTGLREIYQQSVAGTFVIPPELEDCHTAIENRLTENHGELGEKIHTGRSRNDQVLLATRLFLRSELVMMLQEIGGVAESLHALYTRSGSLPMPGYTHLQPGMPSSVGLWIHAFFEQSLELIRDGLSLLTAINANPLGAGSGFDTPLPLDRAYVAKLLGFERVQRSVVDCQNSRGRYERKVLFFGTEVATLVEKLAWDLSLYCTREFGFVRLPKALTTGSSIMPQKRNPDVVELLRARSGTVRGCLQELDWVAGKLPSNYHRDLQLTKEPLLRGVRCTHEMLKILPLVLDGLEFDQAALERAMWPELYATYEVYAAVRGGETFRSAYKAAGARAARGEYQVDAVRGDFKEIAARAEHGMAEASHELALLLPMIGTAKVQYCDLSSILGG
jgi:argininosuccinate lyase